MLAWGGKRVPFPAITLNRPTSVTMVPRQAMAMAAQQQVLGTTFGLRRAGNLVITRSALKGVREKIRSFGKIGRWNFIYGRPVSLTKQFPIDQAD